MGEKHVPDDVGTNVGPPYQPDRGHPKPREVKSQNAQLESEHRLNTNKDLKIPMSEKVRGRD